MRLAACLLLALGCSDAHGSEPDPAHPPHPDDCNPLNFFGTYWVEFRKLDGTCPEQTSGLVRIDEETMSPDATCVANSPKRMRENGCVTESDFSCSSPLGTAHWVGVLTQRDEGASIMSGIVTISTSSCIGTYEVTYSRQ
jgi:hypothetical protein